MDSTVPPVPFPTTRTEAANEIITLDPAVTLLHHSMACAPDCNCCCSTETVLLKRLLERAAYNFIGSSKPHYFNSDSYMQLQQQQKRGHIISSNFSRIWKKSSSIDNLESGKCVFMIKVHESQGTIVEVENYKSMIPEEEAVCIFCFHMIPADNQNTTNNNNNNNNVLKTTCGCPSTLIHEKCATEWSENKGNNKCDVCDEDIQYTHVTLLSKPVAAAAISSTTLTRLVKVNNKLSSILQRFFSCS